MSVAQVKNLQRRLDNLNREAEAELTKACGHELWRTLGFDAFDGLRNLCHLCRNACAWNCNRGYLRRT